MKYYLAIDLGATSGRHVVGHLENGEIILEEIYRFKTGMDDSDDGLIWNIPKFFEEIKIGIKKAFAKYVDEHMVKPAVVYISNSTENGSIYSKNELVSLRNTCDKLGLLLFLDGARLGVALTCLSNDLKPTDIGNLCDVFYVGGTKNGFMSGEAIVFKDKNQ